jgi:hypothetical protein
MSPLHCCDPANTRLCYLYTPGWVRDGTLNCRFVEENALELFTQTLLYEPRIITAVLFAFPLNGNGRRYKPVSVALLKDQFMKTQAGRKLGMPASHEERRGELCATTNECSAAVILRPRKHVPWLVGGNNSAVRFPSLSLLCDLS